MSRRRAGRNALGLARARTYVSPFPREGCSSLCCVVAGRSEVRPHRGRGLRILRTSRSSLPEHGADELKQGLPRRKQARSRWQPTIVAANADASAVSTGSVASERRSADPSTVRPRLAEAAAENLDDIRRTLLDAATSASKPAWVEFECTDCGNGKRVEVPIPDVRARVAAIELLLREGLGRPAQAEEPPTLPRIPETTAEIEALGWEELKALALAYPEAECLPEEKRKSWLFERWTGLTQADRDAFRAALDAADAPPTASTVA